MLKQSKTDSEKTQRIGLTEKDFKTAIVVKGNKMNNMMGRKRLNVRNKWKLYK